MKLITVPHQSLTTASEEVTQFDDYLKKQVKEMVKVLLQAKDPIGVGLAANQVDWLKRVFLLRPSAHDPVTVYINPRIVHFEDRQQPHIHEKDDEEPLEGCLSIPRIWAPVKRHWLVKVEWQDLTGHAHSQVFEGFESAVVQHEIDHLDGILFTQRAAEQGAPVYEERKGKLYRIDLP